MTTRRSRRFGNCHGPRHGFFLGRHGRSDQPARALRSSPTFQAVMRSDCFRGAGRSPRLTMRQTVAAEQAFSALTTGSRTLAESGRESKFLSASGIPACLVASPIVGFIEVFKTVCPCVICLYRFDMTHFFPRHLVSLTAIWCGVHLLPELVSCISSSKC